MFESYNVLPMCHVACGKQALNLLRSVVAWPKGSELPNDEAGERQTTAVC